VTAVTAMTVVTVVTLSPRHDGGNSGDSEGMAVGTVVTGGDSASCDTETYSFRLEKLLKVNF
jgi:hypothetical protein